MQDTLLTLSSELWLLSTSSCAASHLSSLSDFTLLICDPSDRWTWAHSSHRNRPRLYDAHSVPEHDKTHVHPLNLLTQNDKSPSKTITSCLRPSLRWCHIVHDVTNCVWLVWSRQLRISEASGFRWTRLRPETCSLLAGEKGPEIEFKVWMQWEQTCFRWMLVARVPLYSYTYIIINKTANNL